MHLKRWHGAHVGWVSLGARVESALKLMSSEIVTIRCADGVRLTGKQHSGARNRERVATLRSRNAL